MWLHKTTSHHSLRHLMDPRKRRKKSNGHIGGESLTSPLSPLPSLLLTCSPLASMKCSQSALLELEASFLNWLEAACLGKTIQSTIISLSTEVRGHCSQAHGCFTPIELWTKSYVTKRHRKIALVHSNTQN